MFEMTFEWRVPAVKNLVKGIKKAKPKVKDRGAIIPS